MPKIIEERKGAMKDKGSAALLGNFKLQVLTRNATQQSKQVQEIPESH